MWNSSKDPQKEKYQQKLEAILEEKYRVISERSNQLINIIWVILGAYTVILSAILFQSSTISLDYFLSGFLILSIATIFMAFLTLWRCISITDRDFKGKFKIEYGPTQTSDYVIHINKNNMYYSACLKDGEELVERNKKLFLNIENLQKHNHDSVYLLILSILSFIAFISFTLGPSFFYVFGLVLAAIMLYYGKVYHKYEDRIK